MIYLICILGALAMVYLGYWCLCRIAGKAIEENLFGKGKRKGVER
ncbi:MAG: hypothetical protein ACHQYP_05975 [Nitrospiria bacterium]